MDTKALIEALEKKAQALIDASDGVTLTLPHTEISDLAESLRVLRRMLAGKSAQQAFGAPGGWGYGTRIGDALAGRAHTENEPPLRTAEAASPAPSSLERPKVPPPTLSVMFDAASAWVHHLRLMKPEARDLATLLATPRMTESGAIVGRRGDVEKLIELVREQSAQEAWRGRPPGLVSHA